MVHNTEGSLNYFHVATKPELFFLIPLRHYLWALLVAQLVKYPLAMQETSCNAGDADSIPRSGRYPEGGNGNTHQYSCLGNPMDRGAWWAKIHGVTKNQTQLTLNQQQHSTPVSATITLINVINMSLDFFPTEL